MEKVEPADDAFLERLKAHAKDLELSNYYSNSPPVRALNPSDLARLIAGYEAAREALQSSVTAIDDWLNLYASDMCDEKRVQEAQGRVYEYGTLSYIATVQDKNRAALSNRPEIPDSSGGNPSEIPNSSKDQGHEG